MATCCDLPKLTNAIFEADLSYLQSVSCEDFPFHVYELLVENRDRVLTSVLAGDPKNTLKSAVNLALEHDLGIEYFVEMLVFHLLDGDNKYIPILHWISANISARSKTHVYFEACADKVFGAIMKHDNLILYQWLYDNDYVDHVNIELDIDLAQEFGSTQILNFFQSKHLLA